MAIVFNLLPFSIYLTNRATKDRALIDFDSILIPLKNLVTSKSDSEIVDSQQLTSENTSELDGFDNDKLIDIIKNFRQFGLSLNYKQTALKILNSRGISELELKMGGISIQSKIMKMHYAFISILKKTPN